MLEGGLYEELKNNYLLIIQQLSVVHLNTWSSSWRNVYDAAKGAAAEHTLLFSLAFNRKRGAQCEISGLISCLMYNV